MLLWELNCSHHFEIDALSELDLNLGKLSCSEFRRTKFLSSPTETSPQPQHPNFILKASTMRYKIETPMQVLTSRSSKQ
jgi:hypothetical protein